MIITDASFKATFFASKATVKNTTHKKYVYKTNYLNYEINCSGPLKNYFSETNSKKVLTFKLISAGRFVFLRSLN